MKMYIAVLDEVPDYIVPTLVAHSVLGAHLKMERNGDYQDWIEYHFKKCVVRVSRKEFEKISKLEGTCLGYENKTLNAEKSCAVCIPCYNDSVPNVLKFAKLWEPKC